MPLTSVPKIIRHHTKGIETGVVLISAGTMFAARFQRYELLPDDKVDLLESSPYATEEAAIHDFNLWRRS